MRTLTSISLLSYLLNAQKCPEFTCDGRTSKVSGSTCFYHEGDDPVSEIHLEACSSNKKYVCNLEDDAYAWIDPALQFNLNRNEDDPTQS